MIFELMDDYDHVCYVDLPENFDFDIDYTAWKINNPGKDSYEYAENRGFKIVKIKCIHLDKIRTYTLKMKNGGKYDFISEDELYQYLEKMCPGFNIVFGRVYRKGESFPFAEIES